MKSFLILFEKQQLACEDFLRAVAQGRTPDANIDDALINMQILEAVLASI